MYYVPGVTNPYGLPKPAKKRGRKTDLSKYLEKQTDLFPSDLYLARLRITHPVLALARIAADAQHCASGLPARSVARTDSPDALVDTCSVAEKNDLLRGSTADQSGLPDLCA